MQQYPESGKESMRFLALCILLLTTVGYAQSRQFPLEDLPHFPPDIMIEPSPSESPKPQHKKPIPARILCKTDRVYALLNMNTCNDDGHSIVCTYSHTGPHPHQLTAYFSKSAYKLR